MARRILDAADTGGGGGGGCGFGGSGGGGRAVEELRGQVCAAPGLPRGAVSVSEG
jgi:hypothetical protein